jgi:hypothetical protein
VVFLYHFRSFLVNLLRMARFGILMDYIEHAHAADMRRLSRKRKLLRGICDAFELPYKVFEDRYRLSKPLVQDLVEELGPLLKSSRRSDMISAQTKVCITRYHVIYCVIYVVL